MINPIFPTEFTPRDWLALRKICKVDCMCYTCCAHGRDWGSWGTQTRMRTDEWFKLRLRMAGPLPQIR